MKKRYAFAALTVLVLASGTYALRRYHMGGEEGAPPVALPGELAGDVIYECRGGICKTDLETGRETLLTSHGRYPRWSPDGERIAFLRDSAVMLMGADGSGPEFLTRAENPGALNFHPGGREVLFIDGEEVRSYSLDKGGVRTLLGGRRFKEIDISPSGERLIATVKEGGFRVFAFDLSAGTERLVASGCSASLSPDGELFTRLDRSHTRLSIHAWAGGAVRGVVESPRGLKFDNQFWSNHPDWVVSRSEGDVEDIYAHQVSTGMAVRITSSGGADRPDLYLRSAP